MRKNEKQLLAMLDNAVSGYDYHADGDVVDPGMPQQNKLALGMQPGNPDFMANFNLDVNVYYFTESGGTYTERNAAYILSNHAALATQLPCFIFGNSDYAGGFKNAQGNFPLSGWQYTNNTPFIFGKDYPACSFGVLDATVLAKFQVGDLVIPVSAVNGGVNVLAVTVIRCQEVAYGKLLDAINSDVFWINNIRYTVPTADIAQYNNSIKILTESLFGLAKQNAISPTANKTPQQFQDGIIDMPIKKGIDKNQLFGLYINYNRVSFQWSIFVRKVDKLAA